jgi:DNA-binding protein YbaB
LSRQLIETTAGGGLVRIKIDGHRALRSLEIAPEAFEGRDAALLADLIMAAFAEAQRRLDDNG